MADKEEVDSLNEQLEAHRRRQNELRCQEAYQGIHAPPQIRLEIEDIDKKISEIEAQLRGLGESPD